MSEYLGRNWMTLHTCPTRNRTRHPEGCGGRVSCAECETNHHLTLAVEALHFREDWLDDWGDDMVIEGSLTPEELAVARRDVKRARLFLQRRIT